MRKWTIASALIGTLVIVLVGFLVRSSLQPEMRSFSLRYISGEEAVDLVRRNLADATRTSLSVEGASGNTLFVRGSKEALAKVEEILLKEDHPKPQVALRFQIIEANGFTGSDSAIAAVEGALRGLFKFQGYKLVAEAFMRTKADRQAAQTIVTDDGAHYSLQVNVGDVIQRDGKASAEISTELSLLGNTIFSTSVNVPDGQTLVLGTTRPSKDRGALILVVIPEIR